VTLVIGDHVKDDDCHFLGHRLPSSGGHLLPVADGQPGWVATGVHWAAGLVGSNPTLWNAVFAGIQVAPADRPEFLRHLNELHYAYVEETGNPAYRMFLGA